MKRVLLVAAMAAGATLCACTGLPASIATTTSVSADYEATGNASGVRAFVYGKRTVLELPSRPLRLTIHDENGVNVPYEREGRYYRLSRKLERFTVWANTQVLAFTPAVMPTPAVAIDVAGQDDTSAISLPPNDAVASTIAPVTLSARPAMAPTTEDGAAALLRLAAAQLDEVREAIAAGACSAAEVRALNARLDRIEAQLVTAATVMVRVQFDTGSTAFTADERLVRMLVPAARAAQRVNVRGRTDARIAGRDDARIALGRALATRRFLVDQGVDGGKIKVFALAAGRFLAPVTSHVGRVLNRRVEIELVDRRYADLALQAPRQQGTRP